MKLVQILARELVGWPEALSGVWQSVHDHELYFDGPQKNTYPEWLCDDRGFDGRVVRADWEAERARIAGIEAVEDVAQKASAANKDGWIRHSGGKCPVDAGCAVEVRLRNGSLRAGNRFDWAHSNDSADIMAYRLHKPAEKVNSSPRKCEGRSCSMPDSGEHSKECLLDAALDQGWAGPREWRDRITEIDATTSALATERAELVQKLASEGFALIGRINDLLTDAAQKHEDMGDPKNWMEGDLIESVSDGRFDISIGVKYQLVDDCDGILVRFRDDDGDIRDRPADLYKFHSRPST